MGNSTDLTFQCLLFSFYVSNYDFYHGKNSTHKKTVFIIIALIACLLL